MKRLVVVLLLSVVLCGEAQAAEWTLKDGDWYADETGWVAYGDDWYYTDTTGRMVADCVVDGYYISKTGRMIKESAEYVGVNKYVESVKAGIVPRVEMAVDFQEFGKALQAKGWLGRWQWIRVGNESKCATCSTSQLIEMQRNLNALDIWVNSVASDLLSLSDEDKILRAHDIVCDTLYYKYNERVDVGVELGYGQCSVYTQMYKALLNAVGVDCDFVVGIANGGSHAWNRVYLKGQPYLVDVTWDDSLNNYNYFMKQSFDDHIES